MLSESPDFLFVPYYRGEARSPHDGSLLISKGMFLIWPDQTEAVASCHEFSVWNQLMP